MCVRVSRKGVSIPLYVPNRRTQNSPIKHNTLWLSKAQFWKIVAFRSVLQIFLQVILIGTSSPALGRIELKEMAKALALILYNTVGLMHDLNQFSISYQVTSLCGKGKDEIKIMFTIFKGCLPFYHFVL